MVWGFMLGKCRVLVVVQAHELSFFGVARDFLGFGVEIGFGVGRVENFVFGRVEDFVFDAVLRIGIETEHTEMDFL